MALVPAPPFPQAEFRRRVNAVKQKMAAQDLSALVTSDDSHIAYLTGYTAKSGYVPQAVVVLSDADDPVFILRRMDAPAALYQTHLGKGGVIGYAENLVGNPEQDGFDAVIDFLGDSRVSSSGVGLEVPAQAAQKFRARLPAARFHDVTGVIATVRAVKSDLEIEMMRQAGAITDAAVTRAAEVLRPGVPEAEAAAEIIAQLVRGTDGLASTALASFFLCATPRTGTSHIPWADDVLQAGSQVNIELSGMRHGYVAPLMRTFVLGRAPDRLRRVHDAEVAGLEAALAAVAPGRTCGDVAEAFYSAAEARGVVKESRCGYAVGAQLG